MKRVIVALVGLGLIACGRNPVDEFRGGFPSQQQVSLDTPAGSGALTAMSTSGQRSDLYTFTRVVTVGVNASTILSLALLKAIAENNNPTTMTENSATWGPYGGDRVGDGLQPASNVWKLTVTKTAEHTYSYALEAKGAGAADSAFVRVAYGEHSPSVDSAGNQVKDFGTGTLTIDWDAAATLPEHGNDVGKATITYSRPNAQSEITIDVAFTQVHDWSNPSQLNDGAYNYAYTPAQGGSFQFKIVNSQQQTWNIKSRWLQTGAGRSDVRAVGPGITGTATVNECWDTNFVSRYQNYSFDSSKNYGSEQTDCVFTSADYSTL